jgi:hypothetical protein
MISRYFRRTVARFTGYGPKEIVGGAGNLMDRFGMLEHLCTGNLDQGD